MPRSRTLAALAVLGLLALAGGAVGVTYAAFSATTQNSGNSFSASPDFDGLRMATGTYTGNGSDNRSISAGFAPDYVIVKSESNRVAVAKVSIGATTDSSKALVGAVAPTTNMIQELTGSGFRLGTNNNVNQNGQSYSWVAFKAAPGVMSVGQYSGNGSSQSVATGFSPEYVVVAGGGTQRVVARYAGASRTYRHDAHTGFTNGVTSFGATGFTVGSASEVNQNGADFYYVAFNEVFGNIDVGSYTGNGVNDRTVSGAGLSPETVVVRADDPTVGRRTQARRAGQAANMSTAYEALAATATGIRAFEADGFRVGTDGAVNANGVTYFYLAARNTE